MGDCLRPPLRCLIALCSGEGFIDCSSALARSRKSHPEALPQGTGGKAVRGGGRSGRNHLTLMKGKRKGQGPRGNEAGAVSPRNLGLAIDEKKGTLKGHVLPTQHEGQAVVDLGPIGQALAPQPGKTDAYLLGPDKLLSLKSNADGTVTVDTKTLGLESDKKGNFKGDLLPVDGKVDVAGKQLDVSGLKPGKTTTKTIKIKGKKFKVTLRMNEDGTVSVEGKRKKGFFGKVAGFLGKALDFVGKFAPFLAAIPGIGTAVALASKVISGINAVKGFVQSIKTGNWLGALGSAASFVGGFAKGVVGSIANKLSQVTGFAQQALNTFKYGLGKGLLQVVSNGASLLSGAAGLLGNKGLSRTAGDVASYAGAADAAGRGNLLPAASLLANQFGPGLIEDLRKPKKQQGGLTFFSDVRFNTKPTAKDFGDLDFGWLDNGFSVPEGSGGGGGGGGGAPRGVGAGTKGLTQNAQPSAADMKRYDRTISDYMGKLRKVSDQAFNKISKDTFHSALGRSLEWANWIQEPAGANPPRTGTNVLDLATRVPSVPAGQVEAILAGRKLPPSVISSAARQQWANLTAHWQGRKDIPLGPSAETRLAMEVSKSGGNVTPAQLLEMSLKVNNDDYTMAMLTTHNLLKNMASSVRNGPGSQGTVTWNGRRMTVQQRDALLEQKLARLRPPGDNKDQTDIWYHTYAIGLTSLVGSRVAALFAASAESNQSHLDGDWDDAEDRMNREAASAFGLPTTLLNRLLTPLMDWSTGAKRPPK